MGWLACQHLVHLLSASGFGLYSGGISGSRCQGRPGVQPTLNEVQLPDW